jgi:tetratricopeptide (TPR) repeat protein
MKASPLAARVFTFGWLAGLALMAAACSDPAVEKQKHLERGDQYAAEKKDEFAVIEYANAVRLDPKFGEARLKLAETHERIGNIRAAAPEYIRAADALPDNKDAQAKATQILLLAGKFEDAKSRASAFLEKHPQDVDLLLLRANAMAALKDPSGAIAEIEEALKISPGESRAFVNLGAVRMQSGNAKEAEAAFRQAITLAPNTVAPHLALANFLWAAQRPAEAEQSLKQALSIEPKDVLANRMLGLLYMSTQRAAEAEQPLKIIAETTTAPPARFQLADYYLSMRRTEDAKKLLTELTKNPSASAEAETKLAAIDYAENRQGEAHKRVDAVIAKTPKYVPALIAKAQWLTTENQLDEALERAKAAVASDSESAAAHFALAAVQDRRRETADAIRSYTEVLRINPRAAAAQVELARLNLATGNREAALRFAEEARQTDPNNAVPRVALARTLLASGDLTRAEREIAELTKALPDAPAVIVLNGSLQARRGNFPAARQAFERAQQLSPNMIEATAGLVGLDVQTKQVPAAVARIDAALVKQPTQPELLALAAQVYNFAGQPQRAEQALRKAVDTDPRFVQGYGMLAQLFVQQKRLDEAKAEFEGMVKRDPTAVGPRTMVGVLLESQGKREEAKKWYEATVAAVQDAPVVANNLAFIYAEDGTNLDIALQLASSAKQKLPDSADVDDTIGWVYYKKDLPALAVKPFEESLKKRPDNAEVLYHLGLTYAKLGDTARAREALERSLKLNPQHPGHDVARKTLATVSQ